MKFRPCIDIHNGKVKQIIGRSLKDSGAFPLENFVSENSAAFYARMYKKLNLKGGHVIILNPVSSEHYIADKEQAIAALNAWPTGLMVGGGINPDNAGNFLREGASHVIVTSYVFSDGNINKENLNKMADAIGREKLVLDLSCRKKNGMYYIVTDRWQKFSNHYLDPDFFYELSDYCDEFLIHAVDSEGNASGADEELLSLLSQVNGFPITYAGGIGSYEDIERIKNISHGRIDITVGSALDIFGGRLKLEEILRLCE